MIRKLFRDERGNVLIITAIALPILLAAFGLGFETANWYQVRRQMQNAADSAAIAAATNGSANYADEARAVAAQYGFQNGVNSTTVTVSNTATCPAGGKTCYSVSIQRNVKLILAQLIGYTGGATIGSSPAQMLLSSAVASQATQPRNYCLLALAGSGAAQGIRANGVPKADLNGCDVMSNTAAVCNGHNLNAGHGDAHGTSTGCGTTQTSNVPVVSDPYASRASNIPPNKCSSYYTKPSKKKDPNLPASNQLSGTISLSAPPALCGDVQLTGDVTLTGDSTVLVIYNGQLDLNGYTIKTASGKSATIIFSGDNTAGYTHGPTGSGTIDIAAPTSGNWAGVAMYQDPSLTSGVDISEAGNQPTWKITGLVYLPHSNVTFSGAVNKSSNGKSCFVMVVDNVTFNGTGSILAQGECNQAGLTMPQSQIPSRGKLVS